MLKCYDQIKINGPVLVWKHNINLNVNLKLSLGDPVLLLILLVGKLSSMTLFICDKSCLSVKDVLALINVYQISAPTRLEWMCVC